MSGNHLTETQIGILRLYGPNTYGIALNDGEARPLVEAGLVEWVPPKFGATQYAITEAGKLAAAKVKAAS